MNSTVISEEEIKVLKFWYKTYKYNEISIENEDKVLALKLFGEI